jgi:hypothetical protein
MALITFSHIAANLVDVTPEQVGKCYAVVGPDGKKFYQVESSGTFDEHNKLIEYKVTYSKEYGFRCTCPSGRYGFWNVTHDSGVCWHVRAAVAAAIEEKQALRGLIVVQEEEPVNILVIQKPEPMTPEERRDDHRYNGGRTHGLQQLADMRRMTSEIFHK